MRSRAIKTGPDEARIGQKGRVRHRWYTKGHNPVDRIWEYPKERYLSHRLPDGYDAIVEAAGVASHTLTAEAGRLTLLTWTPWKPREPASQNLCSLV